MIKKIKQSKNKKGDGHLGHLPAYLPGPAPPAGPARHRYPPCRLLPSPGGRGRVPDARRHARAPPPPLLATSCFPGLPRCPGRSHAAAPHRSHSPSPSSSPPALSPSHPRTTAAADENHHGHSHPLAPRLCPRAPRRRPRPPHRTTPRWKPCSVDFELFFNLRPLVTSSSIRAV